MEEFEWLDQDEGDQQLDETDLRLQIQKMGFLFRYRLAYLSQFGGAPFAPAMMVLCTPRRSSVSGFIKGERLYLSRLHKVHVVKVTHQLFLKREQ